MGIHIKSADEIDKMREAGRITASVLEMIGPHVQPGVTTEELDAICHDYIVNTLKATPGCLGYHGFPKSICTSVNHVVCHGIPSAKKLKNGDILNIDVTLEKDGFHGDTSKMYVVGKPSVQAERLIRITRECMVKAIHLVKPGLPISEIGQCIEAHAHANRLTVVHEYCGHGVGMAMHEDPQIVHYATETHDDTPRLVPGMTFTIEPMINVGKRHVTLLPDNWTVVTKDRKLTAQWEHTLLVTETGVEVLTRRDEENDLP